jgi:hypothetical protein
MNTDPTKDKADHTLAVILASTDPICQSSLEFDSKYYREVYMVEQGGQLLKNPPNRSNGRPRKRSPTPNVWPRNSTRGRGTMAYRTTQRAHRMSIGMRLLQGDTTQSSTHDAAPTVNNFGTSHDQCVR